MSLPEKKLIALSRDGDPEAFSTLIRQYEGRIYNLARQVCVGLPQEADDVFQETFITAFKKIKQFQGRSELGTWLFRIASNLCLMKARKSKSQLHVPILDDPQDHKPGQVLGHHHTGFDPDPGRIAERRILQAEVQRALEALPVEVRLVVVLRDIEDRSAKEVAQILGLTVSAVKSRLHRGRLFLRDWLTSHTKVGTRA